MRNIIFIALSILTWTSCVFNNKSETEKNELTTSRIEKTVISLCEQNNNLAPENLVRKYDGKIFYDKKVQRGKNRISVTFDFISECCREFDLEYKIDEQTLYICYKPKTNELCECKCNYRGKLLIQDSEIDFDSINRIRIKKCI